LVKKGENLIHVNTKDIAFFVSEDGLTLAYLFDKKRHFINHSIEELAQLVNPSDFYQVNRKIIVNLEAIKTVKTYFNRRLLVEVAPPYIEDVLVSKDRVKGFKEWLDN
jgi:two-component system response regulator LytT